MMLDAVIVLTKSVRSSWLGKIGARSMPRPMTWRNVPGASNWGCLDLGQASPSLRRLSSCCRTSVSRTVWRPWHCCAVSSAYPVSR